MIKGYQSYRGSDWNSKQVQLRAQWSSWEALVELAEADNKMPLAASSKTACGGC